MILQFDPSRPPARLESIPANLPNVKPEPSLGEMLQWLAAHEPDMLAEVEEFVRGMFDVYDEEGGA